MEAKNERKAYLFIPIHRFFTELARWTPKKMRCRVRSLRKRPSRSRLGGGEQQPLRKRHRVRPRPFLPSLIQKGRAWNYWGECAPHHSGHCWKQVRSGERAKNPVSLGEEKESVPQVEVGEGNQEVLFSKTQDTMVAQYIRWTCRYIQHNNELG